jgi:hypothetical protein
LTDNNFVDPSCVELLAESLQAR